MLLAGVGGFLVVRALSDATQFFRDVDDAVSDRADLGTRRFRLQGRVVPGTVQATGDGEVSFQVLSGCVAAAVDHRGDPPELFDNPWIPVLVVGSWQAQPAELVTGADTHVFRSDELIVKHTNEYEADYGDRVAESVPDDFFAGCPDLGDRLLGDGA